MSKKEKTYFKASFDNGGVLFYNGDMSIRLAGNPKFVIEQYVEKYGDETGAELYNGFLEILESIEARGKSTLVMYKSIK